MVYRSSFGKMTALALVCAAVTCLATTNVLAQPEYETIVEFNTIAGSFQIGLYDTAAPNTVTNFLNYVTSSAYDNSFFHRLDPGFVLQGGGFTTELAAADDPVTADDVISITTDDPIDDEPGTDRLNARGTIAMARSGSDTATSQFYFNLDDNFFLDGDNGGIGPFTVFGEVVDDPEDDFDGMYVVDTLSAWHQDELVVELWNGTVLNGAFSELPLVDYHLGDTLERDNLSMIYSVTVIEPVAQVDGLYVDYNGTSAAIPEPGVLMLLGVGVVGLLSRRR